MPSDASQAISGIVKMNCVAEVCSQAPNSTKGRPDDAQGAADDAEQGHAARDESRPVHQVAEQQAVSEPRRTFRL
jgi:hypothetical protein